MSQLSRAMGIARSLVIYHAIPGRQRRMRRLYGELVRRGDLVFDVGAHVGNRTRAFAGLGCRVVAVEPQPDFARLLRRLFPASAGVTIVESAVGREAGEANLAISERTPTVTTISTTWREARADDPEFAGVTWNRALRVPVTTVEALIARFGVPSLVKIDVEGAELDVLAGLEHAVPVVSFEYLPRALDLTAACAARLAALGAYRFNWSPGETFQLASATWLTPPDLIASMRTSFANDASPGDVYARLS